MVELTRPHVSGTEGYAEQAEALLERYESRSFLKIHGRVLPLLPNAPGRIVDIGAGTGRDAAGFAALGYDVLAVEPTQAMRANAERLHPSPRIEWIDGSLPNLACLAGRQGSFHGVIMTDVWMHLDPQQRRAAMPNVARLLEPGGVLAISLRHGPVPKGRRMFQVSASETIDLANAEGLSMAYNMAGPTDPLGPPGVTGTQLAFIKPNDH